MFQKKSIMTCVRWPPWPQLGTNDAHNTCSAPAARKGCTSDWTKDCGGPNSTSLDHCPAVGSAK